MPTIPKFTQPQAKMIRTLEGIVLVVFNVAMLVVPIVTNSGVLSASTAVKYAAIVNSVAIAARSLAKGLMAIQTPLMPATLETHSLTAPDATIVSSSAAGQAGITDPPQVH